MSMKRTFLQWLRAKTLCRLGLHPDERVHVYTTRYKQRGSITNGKGTYYLKRVRYQACPCCGKRLSKYHTINKNEFYYYEKY